MPTHANRLQIDAPDQPRTLARREPWEKLPSETGKAFYAYTVYRNLDPLERSIARATEILADEQPTRKHDAILRQLKAWSREHGWPTRTEAYDVYRDRRFLESRQRAADRAARMEGEIAGHGIRRIAQRLLGDRANNIEPVGIEDMTFAELVMAFRRLVEIRRTSDGQSMGARTVEWHTDPGGPQTLPFLDVTALSDEELDQLIALHEKARPGGPAIIDGEAEEVADTG